MPKILKMENFLLMMEILKKNVLIKKILMKKIVAKNKCLIWKSNFKNFFFERAILKIFFFEGAILEMFFEEDIYVKNIRWIVLRLKHSLFPIIGTRLQAFHHVDLIITKKSLNNKKYYQTKNLLHTAYKSAYL